MTKKELIENGETLEAASGSSTAYARKNEPEWNGDEVLGGDYGISFHQGAMPAHGEQTYATIEELLQGMKKIAPLTEWRISRPE